MVIHASVHPDHTPEQVACPCGEPVQTVEHMLIECPLHNVARRKHLTASGRPRNLSQLFNHPQRVVALLRFLEETGVCAEPQTSLGAGMRAQLDIRVEYRVRTPRPP